MQYYCGRRLVCDDDDNNHGDYCGSHDVTWPREIATLRPEMLFVPRSNHEAKNVPGGYVHLFLGDNNWTRTKKKTIFGSNRHFRYIFRKGSRERPDKSVNWTL